MAGALPAAITGSPYGIFGGGGGSGGSQPVTDPRTPYSGFDPNYGVRPNYQQYLEGMGQPGAGAPKAAHSFPSFDTWGGPDGARASVLPQNPYSMLANAPRDYNKMTGAMTNNQSWNPASYFGGVPMNPRFAQFGNMSGNSYGNKDPFGGAPTPSMGDGKAAPGGAPAPGGKGLPQGMGGDTLGNKGVAQLPPSITGRRGLASMGGKGG